MSTEAKNNFISASRFAVIGRVLTDEAKYDRKVLKWYLQRGMKVVPVKPGAGDGEVVEGLEILSDPQNLPNLSETSISIIINPKIGIDILKSLYPLSAATIRDEPRGVWFQPGAESTEIEAYVKERGLEGKVVCDGACILVSGDGLLRGY